MPLNCQNGDGFSRVSRVKLPDLLDFWLNKSMSTKDCEKECLKNCSCAVYANANITGKGHGCLMWFGDLADIKGFTKDNRGSSQGLKCEKEIGSGHSDISYCWNPDSILGMQCKKEDIEVPLFDLATLTAATASLIET
ncbi:hypothetical protein PTKIN_Ptkin11bG0163000 [Pterospermum kingtungense]